MSEDKGRQLRLGWALALCYFVGFRGKKLTTAVCVMSAESARFVRASHVNTDGSVDRGLFQINSRFEALPDEKAYEAIPNARFAYRLSDGGRDWSPWAAYNNGSYLVYRDRVLAKKVLQLWRRKVLKVTDELG